MARASTQPAWTASDISNLTIDQGRLAYQMYLMARAYIVGSIAVDVLDLVDEARKPHITRRESSKAFFQ